MTDLITLSLLAFGWWYLYRPHKRTGQDYYRNVYLWSPHWRATRAKKIAQVGGKCQGCGVGGRLDVHHLSYANIGAEKMSQLRVLCRECHNKEHKHG